jgi:hypothetical protein
VRIASSEIIVGTYFKAEMMGDFVALSQTCGGFAQAEAFRINCVVVPYKLLEKLTIVSS